MNKFLLITCLTLIGLLTTASAQLPTTETTRRASEKMFQGDINGAMEILDKAIARKKDLVEALKMRARFNLRSGNFDNAIADYSTAIEVKPNDAELFQERGIIRYLQDKNLADALKDFETAISLGSKTERIYNFKAGTKQRLGDIEGAIKDYQTVIGLYPDSAQSYIGLSRTLADKGETENAVATLRGFLDRYEQNRNGKLPKVRGEEISSGIVIKSESENSKEKQVVVGQDSVVFNSGSPEELKKDLKAYEDKKYVANAYGQLGLMYEKQNNFDEALAAFDKALKIDASERNSLIKRGKVLLQKGRYEDAISDFNRAMKVIPLDADIYAQRGTAYLMLGKDDAAQKDFDKYLQLAPAKKSELEKRIADAKEKRAVQPQ